VGSMLPRLRPIRLTLVPLALASAAVAAAGPAAGVPRERADLVVSARDSRDPTVVEEVIRYTVTIANRGPGRATAAVLVADISGAAALDGSPVASAGSCSVRGAARVRCSIRAIGNRRRVTVTIAVRPPERGTLSLTTMVTARTVDPVRRNNRAQQTTRDLGLHTIEGRGVRSSAGDAGRPTVTTTLGGRSDPMAPERASGTFAVQYAPDSRSPAAGSDLQGRITCLRVDGNKASVGGVVESSNTSRFPPGTAVQFAVTDNGDPGPGRDTQVGLLGGAVQPTCDVPAAPEEPLLDGNFTVLDGDS
jgi:hypothetical protein